MGFLSGIGEKLFGGTDNSAQKEQIKANAETQAFIEQMAQQGRGDALDLYGFGDEARNTSYNQALQLLGRSLNREVNSFRNGNYQAQQALIDGMPNFQNAILGLPTEQPRARRLAQTDMSLYRTQLPEFGAPSLQQYLQQSQQQPQEQLLSINDALRRFV